MKGRERYLLDSLSGQEDPQPVLVSGEVKCCVLIQGRQNET